MSLRVSCPDSVAGKFIDEVAQVGSFSYSSCDHQTALEHVAESAFFDLIEYRHQDLLYSGCDDLREIFYGYLFARLVIVAHDLQNLFAEAVKLFRHAGTICELDVLGKSLRDLAFALDVVGDVLSTEWNGCVVAHHFSVVDGYGCTSATEVDQRYSVFHLGVGKDSLGCSLGSEIFLSRRYTALGHYGVDLLQIALLSDEYLEMTFQDITGHADDVVFDDLEIFAVRKRLCHDSVDSFL